MRRKTMNNKRGGAGAIVLLVLFLMLASAVGGAYAYRVLDGKAAKNDALKAVEDVDISDYDTPEQTIIQGYIDDTTKDLESAKTRKEVYDIISDFITDVERVQTKKDKELEQALKEAEEAKRNAGRSNDSNNTDNYDDSDSSGSSGSSKNSGNSGSSGSTGTSGNSGSSDGGYKSNNLSGGDSDVDEGKDGFLGSLLGGLAHGSSGN